MAAALDTVEAHFDRTHDFALRPHESASQAEDPNTNGYPERRQALYDYMRALEAVMVEASAVQRGGHPALDRALDAVDRVLARDTRDIARAHHQRMRAAR